MTSPEDEIKDLREKNNELVQKVQYWKMTAAQRENEKLDLMKENNELRLKLSRLRSGGAAQARKLEAELQSACEEALNHLVLASGAATRTIELAKSYMRDRQELHDSSPRWSTISGTPSSDRVHRVPPLMMGGQSIQPVVSLSRTILNTSNPRSTPRSPNQSWNVTERAVPMHMLQDVYIPLIRIDANDIPGQNVESDTEANNIEDAEELGLEDSIPNERSLEESQNTTETDFEESRRLDAVTEDLEEEAEIETPPRQVKTENPLEGPSWLLDRPSSSKASVARVRRDLEPDSTTQGEDSSQEPQPGSSQSIDVQKESAALAASAFTPTVRRRKRTATPPDPAFSPRPDAPQPRSPNSSFRVLKVLVSKMRMDGEEDASPPKRATLDASQSQEQTSQSQERMSQSQERMSLSQERVSMPARRSRDLPRDSPTRRPVRFDAPSPNGSTDARVIVSEVVQENEAYAGGDAPEVRPSFVTSRRGARSHSATPRDTHTRETQDPSHTPQDSRSQSVASRDTPQDSRSNSVASRDSRARDTQDARSHSAMSRDSHDSDSGGGEEGRTRRPRKAVTYKEKPLNRKMRR